MAKPKKMKKVNLESHNLLDDQWLETRMDEYGRLEDRNKSIPNKYLHESDDPALLYKRKTAELVMKDTLEKVTNQEELTDDNIPQWDPPPIEKPRPTFWSRISPTARKWIIIGLVIAITVVYVVFIWQFGINANQ